jgi:NitT/TauT family transport system ATP-binding protein
MAHRAAWQSGSTGKSPAFESSAGAPIRAVERMRPPEQATGEGIAAAKPQSLAIDARGVSLTFQTRDGQVEALSSVDLAVAEGDFVSFIGPSGCGKTTLLRVIADLERPTAGTIVVNGVSSEKARLQRHYGYIFQAPALYPWRTIERNVALPLEIMGFDAAQRRERVAHYLKLVNLSGFERKFPWQLSGGMQQRASIARALSFEPALLLMDEPFGALDEIVRDHLNEQLLRLWNQTKKTVVFVTHSIPEAVFLSTKIVVMSPRPGRIIDIISCDFPRDRTLEIRETPEFIKIAQRVRSGLRSGHSYDE